MRRALDPERRPDERARAFSSLASEELSDPKSSKILYAEGVRFLAKAREELEPRARDEVVAALKRIARVFLKHLRPDEPDSSTHRKDRSP